MADISDVADTLATLITDAVYPNGAAQPSIADTDIRIYQGWPDPQSLDADMAAGKVHISIFPRPGDQVTSVMTGDSDWQEIANDGTSGTAAREIRRQTKQFQISIWAPTPALRDTIAGPVDVALAVAAHLTMPDGSAAQMAFATSLNVDANQKAAIYRRDFFYAVNFATVQFAPAFAIRQTITNTTSGPTEDAAGPTITLTTPA